MITGMLAKVLCKRPFIEGYHCFNTSFKKRVKNHYRDHYFDGYYEDQIFIHVDDFMGDFTLNLGDKVRFSGDRVEIAIYNFYDTEQLRNLYLAFCYRSFPLEGEIKPKSMKFKCYDSLDVKEEYML